MHVFLKIIKERIKALAPGEEPSVASLRLKCPDWPGTGVRNQLE